MRQIVLLGILALCLRLQAAELSTAASPPNAYDFGTVKQGARVVHNFPLKNDTAAPLAVQSVELSMPGMTAKFKPVAAPGVEASITVEWYTARVSGEIEGEAIVHFADASRQPVSLSLTGVVEPPLEILPFPAVFLSAFQGEEVERRLSIVNHEAEPIAITLAQSAGKHLAASLHVLQPGRTYELVTKIPPGALPGRYEEELSLSTDNPKFGTLTIPAHIFVKPDLYANPEVVDFGRVAAEELQEHPTTRELLAQTFLVKKRTGEFAITSIETNLELVEIQRYPAAGSSSSFRIDVALNPHSLKAGALRGWIQIRTNDSKFPQIRIPVTGEIF